MNRIDKHNKQIAIWLLIGVGMIVVQVLLGGITRLTESGLSITEWKPISGALPPLNNAAWNTAFEKYQLTDQFKFVHKGFTISDFKFIFFWEWFHRLWARLMGMVFLIGFAYFLFTKKFNKGMVLPMIILFVLGGIQGAIGWIMVKSGLVPEKYFVGHIQLATHFIAALGLLCYTLWFALKLLLYNNSSAYAPSLKRFSISLLALLFVQLAYGALMAGLKAGASAPTWPTINGAYFPESMNKMHPWYLNLFYNPIMIHFIHRGIAYLFLLLAILLWFKFPLKNQPSKLVRLITLGILAIIFIQVALGITTVLNATHPQRLILFGVAHQLTAMALLCLVVTMVFISSRKKLVY